MGDVVRISEGLDELCACQLYIAPLLMDETDLELYLKAREAAEFWFHDCTADRALWWSCHFESLCG